MFMVSHGRSGPLAPLPRGTKPLRRGRERVVKGAACHKWWVMSMGPTRLERSSHKLTKKDAVRLALNSESLLRFAEMLKFRSLDRST